MNWINKNQNCSIEFDRLKVGETFFFEDEPYLKIEENKAFNIETDCIYSFEENDSIEPCTHELALRV